MLVESHGSSYDNETGLQGPEAWLFTLRQKGTLEAREELLKFIGVGRKVADCVLLMSMDKREVVPVDTHVHQIAVKHYGFPGSSKAKTAMTPRLYDDVNQKLVSIWGDYAGWAHSVLFTSDLKSFALHNLPPYPSVSPQKRSSLKVATPPMVSASPTPVSTPSPTKRKRKSSKSVLDEPNILENPANDTDLSTSQVELTLADRVKRRRQSQRSESTPF